LQMAVRVVNSRHLTRALTFKQSILLPVRSFNSFNIFAIQSLNSGESSLEKGSPASTGSAKLSKQEKAQFKLKWKLIISESDRPPYNPIEDDQLVGLQQQLKQSKSGLSSLSNLNTLKKLGNQAAILRRKQSQTINKAVASVQLVPSIAKPLPKTYQKQLSTSGSKHKPKVDTTQPQSVKQKPASDLEKKVSATVEVSDFVHLQRVRRLRVAVCDKRVCDKLRSEIAVRPLSSTVNLINRELPLSNKPEDRWAIKLLNQMSGDLQRCSRPWTTDQRERFVKVAHSTFHRLTNRSQR